MSSIGGVSSNVISRTVPDLNPIADSIKTAGSSQAGPAGGLSSINRSMHSLFEKAPDISKTLQNSISNSSIRPSASGTVQRPSVMDFPRGVKPSGVTVSPDMKPKPHGVTISPPHSARTLQNTAVQGLMVQRTGIMSQSMSDTLHRLADKTEKTEQELRSMDEIEHMDPGELQRIMQALQEMDIICSNIMKALMDKQNAIIRNLKL